MLRQDKLLVRNHASHVLNLSPRSLSRYTYGKPVVGVADVRLRIVEHSNGLDVPFPPIPPMLVSFSKHTR